MAPVLAANPPVSVVFVDLHLLHEGKPSVQRQLGLNLGEVLPAASASVTAFHSSLMYTRWVRARSLDQTLVMSQRTRSTG